MFFENNKYQLIATGILLLVLLIIRFILTALITKISRKQGINLARIHLINRYVSVTLFLLSLIIIPFIFGTKASDLIANMTQLIGAPIGATTIERHLKIINQAILNRTK